MAKRSYYLKLVSVTLSYRIVIVHIVKFIILHFIENVSQKHSLNTNSIYKSEVYVLALVPNTYF